MRHEIVANGHGYRLRPIAVDDAPLVIAFRGDAERARHLHAIGPDVAAQEAWLRRYLERPDDYYFVIERTRGADPGPEGLVALYDVDVAGDAAEWGRWIVARGSLAATESAWLIYRVGFDVLGMSEVYCRTLRDNGAVLSFHDRCGLERRRELDLPADGPGSTWRAVEHVLTRQGWPAVSALLSDRSERLAARL
jgi:RimJ/RimL family protein N-acetyltransferase